MNIEIGSTVSTPVSNKDDEQDYILGELKWLKNGFAGVQNGRRLIKVAQDKIEALPAIDPISKPKSRKANPVRNVCISSSGRVSHDNGDSVASDLRGKTLEEVYCVVADQIKIPVPELQAKYSHLNPGQQRMSLGNRLRGHLKRSQRSQAN